MKKITAILLIGMSFLVVSGCSKTTKEVPEEPIKQEEQVNLSLDDDRKIEESVEQEKPSQQTSNDSVEEGYCMIKGDGSNLLYKNDYASGVSYQEKIIYFDNTENKESDLPMAVDGAMYIGAFDKEYISINYNSNEFNYTMSLAYMYDGKNNSSFYNCKTNKFIMKCFDKDSNEIDAPEINFGYDEKIPENLSVAYAMFDITTESGSGYLIGMYNKKFEDNPNYLAITVTLKKENTDIDIENDDQVKQFWDKYADYKIEEGNASGEDYEVVKINEKEYYHRLTKNKWSGEYHQEEYYTSSHSDEDDQTKVVSYDDYVSFVKVIDSVSEQNEIPIEPYYTDKKSNYIIMAYSTGFSWCEMELIDCIEENDKITIMGRESDNGVMGSGSGYFIAIPTNMPVGTPIVFNQCYTSEEIGNLQNYGSEYTFDDISTDKPVIYLYGYDEPINVKLDLDRYTKFTCTYPEYHNGWNVVAKPDGHLIDHTGRTYRYLYWEADTEKTWDMSEGFCIKGCDTAKFLEKQLKILGLNDDEINEFIIYWLPQMEDNPYNVITFQDTDYTDSAKLTVTPEPDSVIRVFMTWYPTDTEINIPHQELVTPQRTGKTVVEWGGSKTR